jgi:DNA helicase-2/ATP-dependent DNA helicase PcrA
VLDYDDLLLHWHALTGADRTDELVVNLFDHILVDEYQDTNAVQLDILLAMRRENGNITVVGDDAQAIYSFRAATVRNILDFPTDFPGTETIRLDQNYRSTMPILQLANAVMAPAARAYPKQLWSARHAGARPTLFTCMDETQQAEIVCKTVLAQRERGVVLREQAVLFRSGHHSDVLEVELARRNIPFVKYGGLKFIETAHVKDMLALLRILENPLDELSWFRVLQLLEGIGPSHAQALIAALGVRQTGTAPAQPASHELGPETPSPDRRPPTPAAVSPLRRFADGRLNVPAAAVVRCDELRQALADCSGLSTAEQIDRLRRFYEPIAERMYTNVETRLRDLQQLEQIASRYESRADFITDLTLDPPTAASDLAGPPLLDDDYLILSTIHSAKGCEWRAVHVIHAADGMIPSDMSTGSQDEVEEERRLFYVALTRAKEALFVYFPLRAYYGRNGRGDRHSFGQLTRFLTKEAQGLMDHDVVYDHTESGAVAPDSGRRGASVDRLLESLLED